MEDKIFLTRKWNKVTNEHVYFPFNNINMFSVTIDLRKNGGVNKVSTGFGITKIIKFRSNPQDTIILDPASDFCLDEIFTYVPICERPKLALVCKQWKRVLADSWFKVKKLELIYWRYDENPNCLAKYSTSDGGYSFLKSLLSKCGRYLTTLDLTAYGNCNIVPVINGLCPNLVSLRLRFTNMDQVILANSFTRLSKLQSLTIIFQNIETFLLLPTVALINSLRNVANTLTDLNLLHWIDEVRPTPDLTKLLNDLIRDLKALKRMEVAGIGNSLNDIWNYLADNGIVYSNHTVYLIHTLSISGPFINTKILKLMECPVRDDTLYTIANTFKHLEVLHINTNWVTDIGVVAISKMNSLQNLYFKGNTKITDSSVKLLKNLIKLGLPRSNKITDDSVLTVLENSPKMDVLTVISENVTVELVKKAAAISKKREIRFILCVEFMPDLQQYESPDFELRIYQEINGKVMVHIGTSAYAKAQIS
ncbi:uncharacterized protein LOC122847649 [Aphidius gifuensis]|uniref:uncharacterized protein LOC122847649 n=1 Tax=Aphidius gifuensis TaxID=684658 RepID=UPI001CDCBF77|nr:uncharacterized protein LOC122847649 [Aphidius gifuensis]